MDFVDIELQHISLTADVDLRWQMLERWFADNRHRTGFTNEQERKFAPTKYWLRILDETVLIEDARANAIYRFKTIENAYGNLNILKVNEHQVGEFAAREEAKRQHEEWKVWQATQE